MGAEEIHFPAKDPNVVNIFREIPAEYITVVPDIANQRFVLKAGAKTVTTPDIAGNQAEVQVGPISTGTELVQGQCGLILPGITEIGLGDPKHPKIMVVIPEDQTTNASIVLARGSVDRQRIQTIPLPPKKLVIVGRDANDLSLQVADVPERTIHIQIDEYDQGHGGPVSSSSHMVATVVQVPRLISGMQVATDATGAPLYIRCLLVQNIGTNPLYF